MDLLDRKIELFVAVYEEGSFRRAAQRLVLSQPAVSEQMRLLERALGFTLFLRTARGVEPTLPARSLYERCVEMRRLSQEAVKEARELAGHRPRLRLGTGRMQHSLLLDDVLFEYRRQFPLVEIVYTLYDADRSIDMICAGEIDVVEYWESPQLVGRECLCTPVLTSKVCCAVPRDHPLASRDCIAPSDLRGERIATNADGVFSAVDALKGEIRKACADADFVDVDLNVPMEQHVLGGCIALVPACYQLQGAYAKLVPLEVESTIEVSLLSGAVPSQVAQDFIELALRLYRDSRYREG